MLIQGNVKNLRSVKCFIVEEATTEDEQKGLATTEDEEKELSVKTNPFLPGGRVSQDGERILELWREGRLSQYSKYQKQVTPTVLLLPCCHVTSQPTPTLFTPDW